MPRETEELIREVSLAAGGVIGGSTTLLTLTLAFAALFAIAGMFLMWKQNCKSNTQIKKELDKNKEGREACEARERRSNIVLAEIRSSLEKCEKRGEELNQLNKDSQQKIKDAIVAQETMSKMLQDTFSKVMDKMN